MREAKKTTKQHEVIRLKTHDDDGTWKRRKFEGARKAMIDEKKSQENVNMGGKRKD